MQAGAISIVDSNGQTSGQLSSLPVTQTAELSMTPKGDSAGAGIDWTVTCGGSPLNGSITGGACGTLIPTHTADNGATIYTAPPMVPYLTNVTITAAVTSDPSASSTLTLPIVVPPVSVSFIVSATSVDAGQTAALQAAALNDPSNAGVTWSVAACGQSDCGSFSPALTTPGLETTYSAPAGLPAGGMVTVTATSVADSTKSASISIAIAGGATSGAISVAVTPARIYLPISGPLRTTHFVATVTNDAAGAGVNWTVSCGSASCGGITPQTASGATATYLGPLAVPSGGKVTVTATSVTDATRSATAVATILATAPIAITITKAPPTNLVVGTTANLAATAANDASNAGVDWSAACGNAGACGTFSLSPAHTASGGTIVFTAPSTVPTGGVVTITAASSATGPANPASVTTTIVPPIASIAFVQEPPASVVAKAQVPVSATVTNDAPGTSGATGPGVAGSGVTWSVQCGSTAAGACGFVTPYQTADGVTASYVAPPVPPGGTVKIIATATAFPQQVATSTAVTITRSTAISIGFVPFAPDQLTTAATVDLIAAVNNDSTNAGVDWTVCAGGCGFFTTVPAMPEIPATATTPLIPAVPAVTATSVPGWPNGVAIPYTSPNSVPQGGTIALAATAHVDGVTTVAADVAIVSSSAGPVTGPTLTGVVQAGTMPVAGATVSLYAAGTTGYGSTSVPLVAPGQASTAITDANGGFTLAGGYGCPSGSSQVYLVAIGGKVGSNGANPNLSMMTALGACSTLGSTPVFINEVTTVASVWPLAPFSTNQPLTGLTGYLNIGSSSTNLAGLANAFAAVNNLVDVTTGQPLYRVPAGNATVPYVEINTLADMLNSCAASAGGQFGDGTPCGNLFSSTAPLYQVAGFDTSLPPSDIVQAAFNAAQHPSAGNFAYKISMSGLYGLVSPGAPFLPFLAAAPQDLSISLHYTDGGGLDPTSGVNSFALDALGDVWISATKGDRVVELSALGAGVSPPTGFKGGGINSPGPIAIDASNDVWISNSDSLTELNSNGTPVQGSPFYGVTTGLNMAIDGHNNVWITNPGGVTEFNSFGAELSPVGGYKNGGITAISQIVIDPSNNVWLGYQPGSTKAFNLAELGGSNGQLIVDAQLSPAIKQTPMVADGNGKIWATPGSDLCVMPPYGGIGTELFPTCYAGGPANDALASIYNANGIALDGAGSLWIANAGGDGVLPNVTEVLPNQTNHYGGLYSPSLGAGPLEDAVDASGNVWVLLSDNTVTEYVGVAVPAQTPIAAALTNKKLGKTP